MMLTSPAYDFARCKMPVMSVPIHEDFCAHIGRIIGLWSAIERMHSNFLIALCNETSTPKDRLDSRFRKRLAKLRSLSETVLPRSIAKYFSEICDETLIVYRHRNLLAHGSLEATSNETGDTLLIAKGESRGTATNETYTVESIEQVFYDASHVAGKLFFLEMAAGAGEGAKDYLPGTQFSSQDIQRLVDFYRSNHPSFAKTPTP